MQLFWDMETLGIYVGALLFTLLAVLLPMSAYAAQKWAHKTYLEVRTMNGKLTELIELIRDAETQAEPETLAEPAGSGKRREPTLGRDHL